MTARHTWLAVAALLACGATAHAQQRAPSALAAADTTLDAPLAREIAEARARGLPAEPLLAKVREGRLKRATGPRILVAVSALAARLDTARAALGPTATAAELVAGADAIAAGANASALRAVGSASLGRPVSAPLGTLAQLVASGVPTPRAVTLIVDLLRRQATAAQVIAFGNAVQADAVGGLPADEAATFRWRELGSSGAAESGRAAVTSSSDLTPTSGSAGGDRASSPSPRTPRRRP